MGMHLIAYINNIMILAESKEMALDHVESMVYLSECLEFGDQQRQTGACSESDDRIPWPNDWNNQWGEF